MRAEKSIQFELRMRDAINSISSFQLFQKRERFILDQMTSLLNSHFSNATPGRLFFFFFPEWRVE